MSAEILSHFLPTILSIRSYFPNFNQIYKSNWSLQNLKNIKINVKTLQRKKVKRSENNFYRKNLLANLILLIVVWMSKPFLHDAINTKLQSDIDLRIR